MWLNIVKYEVKPHSLTLCAGDQRCCNNSHHPFVCEVNLLSEKTLPTSSNVAFQYDFLSFNGARDRLGREFLTTDSHSDYPLESVGWEWRRLYIYALVIVHCLYAFGRG